MKNESFVKKAILVMIALGLLYTGVTSVFGVQGATSVTPGVSSRGAFGNTSLASTDVQAGNITELNVSGASITTHWAGFYGEITGGLTLANSAGNVFYNWTSLNYPVSGKVFASTSNAVDWNAIACIDMTGIASLETALGIDPADGDRINQTFTSSAHPGFTVGGTALSGCNSTNAHTNTGLEATTFYQILLADNDGAGDAIFTTLINDSTTGFDNAAHDFELLVGESDGAGTTEIFFYIELN
jgi:hypothetical protein